MVVSADVLQKIKAIGAVRATPLAKLKAADAGIDLHGRTGSGPRGMVRCEDLAQLSTKSEAAEYSLRKTIERIAHDHFKSSWSKLAGATSGDSNNRS